MEHFINVYADATGGVVQGYPVETRAVAEALGASTHEQRACGLRLAYRVRVRSRPYLTPAEREMLHGAHAGRH